MFSRVVDSKRRARERRGCLGRPGGGVAERGLRSGVRRRNEKICRKIINS